MAVSRKGFLLSSAAFLGGTALSQSHCAQGVSPWETPDGLASHAVWLRRIYLDLTGQLPPLDLVQHLDEQVYENWKEELVDQLLSSDDFADYWSLPFADWLRVKSEFPINLWPNAVYVFHRRIHEFIHTNESWEHFTRALMLSSGSNFRQAEVNFYRATAERTSEGYAQMVLRTFWGCEWNTLSPAQQTEWSRYFTCVHIKNTREWKEEIVQVEGEDTRLEAFSQIVQDPRFDATFVRRVQRKLLDTENPTPEEINLFRAQGRSLRALVRHLVLSDAYQRGSVTGGFPCRRLEAEVLEDVLCQLLDVPRAYQSIAPEPFTFLPPKRKSVLIEDGSITSAFLLLFGRPARDTGLPSERSNEITAKQRLYLFNSTQIYNRIFTFLKDPTLRTLPLPQKITALYERFLSRKPTAEELHMLQADVRTLKTGRAKGRFAADLVWCLINTREFLYQH